MKISLSWSSGKDSGLAFYYLLNNPEYVIGNLHTTFDSELKRVGMHGVREELVLAQANSIGLSLDKIYLQKGATNANYEDAILSYYRSLKEKGVEGIAFGDIFLSDLKAYRERLLEKVGLQPVFPLWGKNTSEMSSEILEAGFKVKLCSLRSDLFKEEDLAKDYDQEFLSYIAGRMDPCGENGEFHTFLYNAPYFKNAINFKMGERVLKRYDVKNEDGTVLNLPGFWFVDLYKQ
jgi:uncharacterized protein (TIGR00290 family)